MTRPLRETPGRARSLLDGALPGALPTPVHHAGETECLSESDPMAVTESSSMVHPGSWRDVKTDVVGVLARLVFPNIRQSHSSQMMKDGRG